MRHGAVKHVRSASRMLETARSSSDQFKRRQRFAIPMARRSNGRSLGSKRPQSAGEAKWKRRLRLIGRESRSEDEWRLRDLITWHELSRLRCLHRQVDVPDGKLLH